MLARVEQNTEHATKTARVTIRPVPVAPETRAPEPCPIQTSFVYVKVPAQPTARQRLVQSVVWCGRCLGVMASFLFGRCELVRRVGPQHLPERQHEFESIKAREFFH